jgi:hypothetical protein
MSKERMLWILECNVDLSTFAIKLGEMCIAPISSLSSAYIGLSLGRLGKHILGGAVIRHTPS